MNKFKLINDGFIPAPPALTSYIAGAYTQVPYEVRNETGDWTEDLPEDEQQSGGGGDTNGCVPFSANNIIETQLNRMLRLVQLPKFLAKWLHVEGYIKNGKVNSSDRFSYKMGKTGPKGTTLDKNCDSFRHNGIIPESDWSWDFEKPFSLTEYNAEIPQVLKDKGKKFLEYFDISYEVVRSINSYGEDINFTSTDKELKHAPLQFASATCPPWGSGIIPACQAPAGHAYQCFNLNDKKSWIDIFDTYNPFRKKLASDYGVPYIHKIVVSVRTREITTDMIRWAYCVYEDVRKAFPASLKFYSPDDPNYSIYQWAYDWGQFDHPEAFKKDLDWSGVDSGRKAEAETIELPKKKDTSTTPSEALLEVPKNFLNFLYLIWRNLTKNLFSNL